MEEIAFPLLQVSRTGMDLYMGKNNVYVSKDVKDTQLNILQSANYIFLYKIQIIFTSIVEIWQKSSLVIVPTLQTNVPTVAVHSGTHV